MLTLQIYEGQPKHNALVPSLDPKGDRKWEKMLPVSSVVINASRLFARLRM